MFTERLLHSSHFVLCLFAHDTHTVVVQYVHSVLCMHKVHYHTSSRLLFLFSHLHQLL